MPPTTLPATTLPPTAPSPAPQVTVGEWVQIVVAIAAIIIALLVGGKGLLPFLIEKARARRDRKRQELAAKTEINTLPERIRFTPRGTLLDECLEKIISYPGLILDGPRGCGKTALALELAHRYLSSLRDAGDKNARYIAWVSAKHRTMTAVQLLDEIAYKLGFAAVLKTRGPGKASVLTRLLTGSQTLIVVDNFESLLADEVAVIAALGHLPSGAKVLITTSHSITALHSYALRHIGGMRGEESLELMRQELSSDPQLRQRSITSQTLEKLHVATGGMPLAIMWTLGRLREGAATQGMLDLLRSGHGSVFDEMFNDTWTALSPTAHQLLNILALFTNDVSEQFLLAAINSTARSQREAVVALEELQAFRLVERRLRSTPEEEVVYSLHPLTHTFVQQKADKDQLTERSVIEPAASYYLSFMEQRAEGGPLESMSLVSSEIGNVLQTLELALAHALRDLAVRLAIATEESLLTLGLLNEREKYGLLLANYAMDVPGAPRRSRLLTTAAQAVGLKGEYERSEEILRGALREAEDENLPAQIVRIQRARAANYYRQGLYEAAGKILEGIEQAAELSGDRYALIDVLYLLANHSYMTGAPGVALHYCERMLEIVRLEGIYDRARAYALEQAALIYVDRNELRLAREATSEAEEVARRYSDYRQVARVRLVQAKILLRRGRMGSARRLADIARGEFERLGLDNESEEARALLSLMRGSPWRRLTLRSLPSNVSGKPLGGD